MDISKKKVLFIPSDNVLTDGGGYVRQEVLDRICQSDFTRIAIITENSDDKYFKAKVKAIEIFVFSYCKTAVSSHKRSDMMVDEVMQDLPYSCRKRECMLSVGEHIDGIDYVDLEKFVK